MNIPIGEKLTSNNIHNLISQNWDKSTISQTVTFDFSQTEWVSNSEITFLIAWINYLKSHKVNVSIQLPKISPTQQTNDRRTYFQKRILIDWQIQRNIPNDVKILDGGISTKTSALETINEYVELPIFKYSPKTFDKLFDEIYDDYKLGRFSKKTNELANLNHLDSDLLNRTILKELYSNVIIHSELNYDLFCQYSFSINKKIPENKLNKHLLEQRTKELSSSEKTFFIRNNKYRNIDFVEIEFQDLGIGISQSLQDKYKEEKKPLHELFGEEIKQHQGTNYDSKVLHYALLLFTSKYEVHKRFEVHDYIPRGLYILQELVAKHQGYLEIRSKKGAIGISYLDGKRKLNFANKDNDTILFPGTKIKIVFPSKDSIIKINYTGHNRVDTFNESNTVNHISLIKHINESLFKLDNSSSEEEKKVIILSYFFENINKELISFERNSIICLDFAGIDKRKNDILIKLLMFIIHSPINSSYRIVIVNNTTREINNVINDSIRTNKSKGLHIYPIPVVYPDLDIDWIGISEKHLINRINNLWKIGPDEYHSINEDLDYLNSTILVINEDDVGFNLRINLPSFEDFIGELNTIFYNFINDEINNSIINYPYLQNQNHNYNEIIRKKDGYVFLTSYGDYQDRYLSFNNKLYMTDYAQFMVTHLIFSTNKYEKALAFDMVDKILSVTLSSQFLALSMRDVLKELYNVDVKVIALSNYYEFYKEKRFEEIEKNDKVLVINDIISTGRLTENIFDSLEKREAKPLVCFALADFRNNEQIQKSVFKEIYPTIALNRYSIQRFENLPDNKKIEWINPILNAPTTLKKGKNHIQSLLNEDDFLEYIIESDVLVGNVPNNSYYLTYYLKTDKLLKREFTKLNNSLLHILIDQLNFQKNKKRNSELEIIKQGLGILKNNYSKENKGKIINILSELNEIETTDHIASNDINLVCYPLMSNIQEVENEISIFKNLNQNNSFPDIYPIPRVLTERGWRFTFPPKFLNILSTNKPIRVLILDDGSCTGGTIVQMIDSISFLTVESIDVLSIFGRLEDYQKEFFHRIRSVRTKNNVVPINVYFGVHMNLPILTERENSFNNQIQEVKELQNRLNKNDDNFKEYLENFEKKLLVRDNIEEDERELIPWGKISKIQLIKFRNQLGKFDSYRLYSEDIPDSGNFIFWENEKTSLLTLLTVLNLEPNLYKVLKRIVPPEIIINLYQFSSELIKNSDTLNEYQIIFLIKSLSYLNPNQLFQNKELYNLIVSIEKYDVQNAYYYLNYVLLLVAYDIRNIEDVITKRKFLLTCSQFLFTLKTNNKSLYHKQFRFFQKNIINLTENQIDKKDDNINYYRKLRTYFEFASINKENHPEKVLDLQLNKLELKLVDYIEDPEYSSEEFAQKLIWFREKYFNDQDEYKYIQKIIKNLSDYKPKDLNFNPTKILDQILDFESVIQSDYKSINTGLLSELIVFYREHVLFETAKFNQFIQQSESTLQDTWEKIEDIFVKDNPSYKPVIINQSFNDKVEVNQYVILLTFENILKNKIQYAKEIKWEIDYEKIGEEKCIIRFKQYSSFVTGGTGNGQAEIKKFLEMNGAFYIREETYPSYIFRIEMPLKK